MTRDLIDLTGLRFGKRPLSAAPHAGADESARTAAKLEERCAAIRAESGKEG